MAFKELSDKNLNIKIRQSDERKINWLVKVLHCRKTTLIRNLIDAEYQRLKKVLTEKSI